MEYLYGDEVGLAMKEGNARIAHGVASWMRWHREATFAAFSGYSQAGEQQSMIVKRSDQMGCALRQIEDAVSSFALIAMIRKSFCASAQIRALCAKIWVERS